MSHELSPWWLRCFAWQNQLYFFSLKTGRIVHRNEVGSESVKIRTTGSSNCLILDTRSHLLLIVNKYLFRVRKNRSKEIWKSIEIQVVAISDRVFCKGFQGLKEFLRIFWCCCVHEQLISRIYSFDGQLILCYIDSYTFACGRYTLTTMANSNLSKISRPLKLICDLLLLKKKKYPIWTKYLANYSDF